MENKDRHKTFLEVQTEFSYPVVRNNSMNTEICQMASIKFYQFTEKFLDREHVRSELEVHCILVKVCMCHLRGVKQPW